MSLSILAIEAALPGQTIRDEAVKGLHLRVFDRRKSFYLYFTTKGGRERRPKIGDYPTISLTAARRVAREMLEQVAAGGDPSADRQAERIAPTVADLTERYTERHGNKKKPKPAAEDRRMIRQMILPAIGKLKVADVRMTDIEDMVEARKETPYAANRLRSLTSKMFNLAEKWEMRPSGSNPCRHVAKYKEHKRRRYLSREEAIAVVERLHHYEMQYLEQAAFIWLQIYTGARPSEIAALEPKHRSGAVLTLTEHKTDESTGDVRVIHLPPQGVAILDRLRGRNSPAPKGATLLGIASPRHLWKKIMADTGIKRLRPYDLRHSFASLGLSNGLSLPQIGELMGHKSPLTTARYAHLIDETARAAAAQTADAFDAFAKPLAQPTPPPARPALRIVK